MPCTTVLAGKLATNDRSTMIARTDDNGVFTILCGRRDVKCKRGISSAVFTNLFPVDPYMGFIIHRAEMQHHPAAVFGK